MCSRANNRWIENPDGTYTARPGATLYGLFGEDWREKSGFEGDPTDLQPGDTVPVQADREFDFAGAARAQNMLLPQLDSTQMVPRVEARPESREDPSGFGRVADYLGYASTGLTVLGGVVTFTPAAPAAPVLFKASAVLTGLSAGAYAADEDYASAGWTVISLGVGLSLPAPSYNVAAGRFTASSASRVLSDRHAGQFIRGTTARKLLRRNAAISTGISRGISTGQNFLQQSQR